MRLVEWVDDEGFKHLSYVRDNDPDSFAPRGLSADPPSLDTLDWFYIKRDLWNLLVDSRILTWQDVTHLQNGVSGAILGALRQKVVALYRRPEKLDDTIGE